MSLKNPNLLTLLFIVYLFMHVQQIFAVEPKSFFKFKNINSVNSDVWLKQVQQPELEDQGIFLSHFFDFFENPYILRRHVLTAGYKHQFGFGEIIPKINIGQNVGRGEYFLSSPGFQVEMDAYPIIDPTSYLYLNAGFSGSEIFPEQRYGAEYFKSVLQNWEVSAGFRYLKWEDDIFLFTGSVARYLSSWWISFRPYIAVSSSSTYQDSYHLTIRRYFNPHREYLYFILSTGDSPDQPVFLIENFGNFSSSKIQIGIIKTIYNQIIGKIGFGYQYEEFQDDIYRNRFQSVIGVEYRF
jgi:YaiO family outer membrane protein